MTEDDTVARRAGDVVARRAGDVVARRAGDVVARRAGDAVLAYYEACLAQHGDAPQGAGWPNAADLRTRFDVILDIMRATPPAAPVAICDLGCGSGALLAHLHAQDAGRFSYLGIDRSDHALAFARGRFPDARFVALDPLAADARALEVLRCDYLVANGLFTVRDGIDEEAMWCFMTSLLERVWPLAARGLIFNVMSPVVDWRRDDLFHVSYDRLAQFLHGLAGRSIGFRADYGLYEYMAYALRR